MVSQNIKKNKKHKKIKNIKNFFLSIFSMDKKKYKCFNKISS